MKDEEHNFNGLWLEDYSNYQEFLNDCNGDTIPLSEDEFNQRTKEENYWYEYGLHEEEVDFFPEDPPMYLANLIMVKPVKEE